MINVFQQLSKKINHNQRNSNSLKLFPGKSSNLLRRSLFIVINLSFFNRKKQSLSVRLKPPHW
jgi:hypothetical protein